MIHGSFAKNNSELFPGIQILAFIYNETNEFQDFQYFEEQIRDQDVNLNDVNFTALLPEQEELFSMIRTCLWEGQTLDSTLQAVHFKKPMDSMLSLSKEIVQRLKKNIKGSRLSLPANMSQQLDLISWGTHDADLYSQTLLVNLIIELQYFDRDLKENSGDFSHHEFRNISNDSTLLASQLSALTSFIDLSDCQRLKELYHSLNVNFCRSFLGTSNMIAWLLTLLCLIIVLAFFVGFYAGHRVFSRALPPRPSLTNEKNVQATDAAAPLLSSPDKYYYATGPVSYNPAPPPYNSLDGNSAHEKL